MLTPSKLIILIFLFPLLDYSTGRYLQLQGMPYHNDLTRVFFLCKERESREADLSSKVVTSIAHLFSLVKDSTFPTKSSLASVHPSSVGVVDSRGVSSVLRSFPS